MYKIRKYNTIAEKGLKILNDLAVISSDEKNPDAILLRSYKLNSDEFGDNLKCIGRAGAGVNNIPVDDCTKTGIVVFNTPGANANAVKELVIAGLLMASRKLIASINELQEMPDKDDIGKKAEKIKSQFAGPELQGKTLGIIGLGAIGVMVAQAAVGLNMKVIGYDPYLSVVNAWNIPQTVKQASKLDELLSESDYISLHMPATDKTKHFINSGTISKMKDHVRIVNFARGSLVNSSDIIEALNEKKVAKYVTDFADEKIIEHENIVCLPHLGASTPEAEENCAVLACTEIKDYLTEGNITNAVNFPDFHMARTTDHRVTLLHANKPGMLERITDIFSKNDQNIAELGNNSQGGQAYTVIDTDESVNDEMLNQLENLEGITKVRCLS